MKKKKYVDESLRGVYRKKNPFCEWCLHGVPKLKPSTRGNAEIHHVFGGTGGRYDLWSNLMTLCSGHHDWATDNETAARIVCLAIKFFKDYGECVPPDESVDYNRADLCFASGKNVAGYVEVMIEMKADIIPEWVKEKGLTYLMFERTWYDTE